VDIIDGLEYGRVNDRPLLATLYRPANADRQATPAMVWIHGGAWMGGSRDDDTAYCRRIAESGMTCLAISYRLSGEAIFPAAIEDCKCAVRYLRAHADQFNLRAEAIGAWGPSAGGHLAVLLGTSAGAAALEGNGGWPEQSSAVQVVGDWYGPTDFLQMSAYPSDMDHDAADSPESRFIGGAVQHQPEAVQRANPISYISANTPPIYIAHGTADPLVPFNQSQLLYDALVAAGIDVTFDVMNGAGHGGPGFEADSLLMSRCLTFFRRRLLF
jgi:acetyl esterase/lipase